MKDWEFDELFCAIKETYYEFIAKKRGQKYAIARLMDEFYNLGEVEDILVHTAIGEIIVQQDSAFIGNCNVVKKYIENVDRSILLNELTKDEINILFKKIKVILNKIEKIKKLDA